MAAPPAPRRRSATAQQQSVATQAPPELSPAQTPTLSPLPRRPPQRAPLTQWCRQGVLLLNASLTVRAGTANSHSKAGWGSLTAAAVAALSQRRSGIVFLLW